MSSSVEITPPPDPSAPLKLLLAGKVDIAVSYEPELLLARDKDLGLVSVGALVQKPLTSLMSLPQAGIRSASDLRGKRVGTAGIPYQAAYLRAILTEAGADPEGVPLAGPVEAPARTAEARELKEVGPAAVDDRHKRIGHDACAGTQT